MENNICIINNKNRQSSINKKELKVQKKKSNCRGNYILGETIGKGAFAKVKIATHIQTNQKVAIKILSKQNLLYNPDNDGSMSSTRNNSNYIDRIKKEINITKQLKHKNIIQLYEIMESSTSLYIVMEYCEGKELFDYIIKRKHLSEREACRFFQQIINGVEYLHIMNVTHRDLKPENLLLDNKKRIKISDFGLSSTTKTMNSLLSTPCGTPSYAPPEMLRGCEYNGVYSDIYSCGIILYTMLCGNLPCADSREELIYQTIITHNYDYPSYVSNSAINLIENMIKIEPTERFNFQQIKNHPWFNMIKPQMKPGILVGLQYIPVDEDILKIIETNAKKDNFKFPIEECRKNLKENKCDSLSALYYLTLKQVIKEGKKSISDLYSDIYINYIQDISSWIDPEKINDVKYKDYWINNNNINSHNNTSKSNNNTSSNNNNHNPTSVTKLNSPAKVLNKYILNNKDKYICKNNSMHSPKINSKDAILSNNTNKYNTVNMKKDYVHNNQVRSLSVTKKTNSPLKKHQEKFRFSTDLITKESKEKLINKISKQNDIYSSQISIIENMDNYPFTLSSNSNNSLNNMIQLIASKLLGSTIFGKFLLNFHNKKDNNFKVPINGEIVDKFFLTQKYKNLLNEIKLNKFHMFKMKKFNNLNLDNFGNILNDDEDYMFSDSFLKGSMHGPFIQKIKKSIIPARLNKFDSKIKGPRRKSYLSSKKAMNSSFSDAMHNRLNTSGLSNNSNVNILNSSNISNQMNNSAYHKRNFYSMNHRLFNPRKNRFLKISTFINDHSTNKINKRENSVLSSNTNNSDIYNMNNKSINNLKINSYSKDKSISTLSNYTSKNKNGKINSYNKYKKQNYNRYNNNTTNNYNRYNNTTTNNYNISGYKNLLLDIQTKNNNNNNNNNAKDKTDSVKFKYSTSSMGGISEDEELPKIISNTVLSNKTKYKNKISNFEKNKKKNNIIINTNNNNILNNIDDNINNNTTRSNFIEKIKENHDNMDSKEIINIIKSNFLYLGPVDIRCIFSIDKNKLENLITSYLKKINYFFKVKKKKIKCSSANLSFEIYFTKIPYIDDTLNYLKFSLKNGDITIFKKVTNDMLNKLPK